METVFILTVKSEAPVITIYGNRYDAEAEARRLKSYSVETEIQEYPVIGKMGSSKPESPIKHCIMCDSVITPFAVPALREKQLCSWRCWGELYGEP